MGETTGSTTPARNRFLQSRVARRVFTLFVVCSLIPLTALAFFSLYNLSWQLKEQAGDQLRQTCKSAGMAVLERLMLLEADLETLAGGFAADHLRQLELALSRFPNHTHSRFRGLTAIRLDGQLLSSTRLGRHTPQLNRADLKHLQADRTLVKTVPSDSEYASVLLMRRCSAPGAEHGILVAEVDSSKLWHGEGVRVPGHEIMVLDEDLRLLFSTSLDEEAYAGVRRAIRERQTQGRFGWTSDGKSYLAHYRKVFMRARFRTSWTMSFGKTNRAILEPVRDFQWYFILIVLLAFLVAIYMGQSQIRKSMGPFAELRDATQRIAEGDLDFRLFIHSRDEFEDLGEAFNHMADRLVATREKRDAVEQELIEARDRALAAARTEAEFVANVSHELRTPMTSLSASAEILRNYEEEDPETRAEFLEIMLSETTRLTKLVDDVLDFSAIQRGQLQLNFEDVQVNKTIREVARALSGLASEREIEIDLLLEDGLPDIYADHDRLKQVWTNLVSNAIKFSPVKKAVLVRSFESDRSVIVEVIDEGPGIREEDRQLVFERFRQVSHDLVTEKPPGTGLGLTISREIVDGHGGTIEVDGAVGAGSVFRVLLPIPSPTDVHVQPPVTI